MQVRTKIVIASALVAALGAFALPARAADVPITEEARIHFTAGVDLLQDPKAPRYEEAYREFKVAYAASPSYKILGNLGLCAMKIERDGEAIQAYEQYLKEAGFELAPEEREQLQRDLLILKTGNSQATVSSDPPGAAIVDVRVPVVGPEVRNTYGDVLTPLTLALRHGHHIVKAHLAGYVDQDWEFEATGSSMPPHVFQMQRPPKVLVSSERINRGRPIPTAPYVVGGVSLALAAAGSVVGALALKKHDDFNAINDGTNMSLAQSDRSTGQTLNVATDCLFGAAIIGAAVTVYLVLTRPTVIEELLLRSPTVIEGAAGSAASRGAMTAAWTF